MSLDPRIGTEIAGFRIEAFLGRGGMSIVYRAEHLALGRRVALKVMAPELAESKDFRERFVRESRLAAGLDHPNIIPIYEAGEADGLLYIAMRYVEGRDLKSLLQREGALEPTRAVGIVTQTAGALDCAHEQGLVHRDVKPQNVLIVPGRGSRADHVYLSDFGLTKRVASLSGVTGTGQLLGSIEYVAPEQIEGKGVDRRADVYSLACVAYECLTGEVPYDRESEVAVLWAHLQDAPPSVTSKRQELPAALDEVLARGMAKSPDERYSTCGELVEALEHQLLVARPSGPPLPLAGERPRARARARTPPSEKRAGEDRARAPERGRRPLPPALSGRNAWLVSGLAAIAAAAAATLLLLRAVGGPAEGTGIAVDSVGRVDARTGELVASMKVGDRPTAIALGEGSVWVANAGDNTLSRIDPRTGEVVSTVDARGDAGALAVGFGGVWVLDGPGGAVSRLDPATGRIVRRIHFAAGGSDIAVGDGAVWVTNELNKSVIRIDPKTNRIVASIGAGESPGELDVGAGAVWVANTLSNKLSKIDPRANRVVDEIGFLIAPNSVAVGEGAVWVTNTSNDTVTRVDPGTNSAAERIRVGNGPTDIAVGDGAVWVVNRLAGTLSRIDPNKNAVVFTLDVGNRPGGIAVGSRVVWFTVHA